MPTEEYRKLVKKQSPNNLGGRNNYIYETKNLRGFSPFPNYAKLSLP